MAQQKKWTRCVACDKKTRTRMVVELDGSNRKRYVEFGACFTCHKAGKIQPIVDEQVEKLQGHLDSKKPAVEEAASPNA